MAAPGLVRQMMGSLFLIICGAVVGLLAVLADMLTGLILHRIHIRAELKRIRELVK